jgi:hypothetical protein
MTTAWIVAYALLAGLSVVLVVLVLALARYVGTLSSRLPQPVALGLDQGPELGTALAETALAPNVVDLLQHDARAKTLLVFLSTHCAACNTLVGELNLFTRDRPDLDVVAVVGGESDGAERMVRALRLEKKIIDQRQAGRSLGITTLPFGLMYREGTLVAKGVVNSRDMLDSLAEGHARMGGDALLEAFAGDPASAVVADSFPADRR